MDELKKELVFYPPRLWGLDPLFDVRFRLYVSDVLTLPQYSHYQGVFSILNHVVTNVCIMGDVRMVDRREKSVIYHVDDGTGCIRCNWWRQQGSMIQQKEYHAEPNVESGDLVRVIGKVSEYNGRKDIIVNSIINETNPNAEVFHWLEVNNLKKTVYNKQFVLPSSFIDKHIKLLKPVIKEKLLQFLQEQADRKVTPFTLEEIQQQIRQDSNILSEISSNLPPTVCPDLTCELHEVMTSLVSEGYFISSLGNHPAGDHYVFMSDDDHVIPIILAIFERYKDLPDPSLSVEQILLELTHQNKLQNLPRKRIEHVLQVLVERNDIYPVGECNYRRIL